MLNKEKKDSYEETGEDITQNKINFLLVIAVVVVTICAAVVFYQNYMVASCC